MSRERQGRVSIKQQKYLSAHDVAERYGRPVTWVYSCKKIPRRKVGKYLMFLESDLSLFEDYRKEINRGFYMEPDPKAVIKQNGRKRLRFDCL